MMGTVRFSKIVETAGKPIVHTLWIEPAKDSVLQNAIKANRVMTIHQRPAGTKTDYGTVGFEKKVSGEVLIFPKSLRAFADKRVIGVNYDLLDWPAVPRSQEAPKPQPPKPALKSKPKEIPPVAVERPVVKERVLPKIQQAPKADPAKPAIKSEPKEIPVAAAEQPVAKESALPKIQQALKADPAKPAIKGKPKEIPVAAAEQPVVKESASNGVVKFPTPTFENKDQPIEGVAQIKEQVRQAMKALEEGREVAAFNLLKRIVE